MEQSAEAVEQPKVLVLTMESEVPVLVTVYCCPRKENVAVLAGSEVEMAHRVGADVDPEHMPFSPSTVFTSEPN